MRLDLAHHARMDKSRMLTDALLTIVLVMLLLGAFSNGTVTVPMPNGSPQLAADEPTWDEVTAKFAEIFSSL